MDFSEDFYKAVELGKDTKIRLHFSNMWSERIIVEGGVLDEKDNVWRNTSVKINLDSELSSDTGAKKEVYVFVLMMV